LIQRDDGMALGLLFQQEIPVYAPGAGGADAADTPAETPAETLADIESELRR
jgi:hypothetical protein